MSRSPRKSLRRAHDALTDLFAVLEQYPESRSELAVAVGAETLDTIAAGHAAIERAVQALEAGEEQGRV